MRSLLTVKSVYLQPLVLLFQFFWGSSASPPSSCHPDYTSLLNRTRNFWPLPIPRRKFTSRISCDGEGNFREKIAMKKKVKEARGAFVYICECDASFIKKRCVQSFWPDVHMIPYGWRGCEIKVTWVSVNIGVILKQIDFLLVSQTRSKNHVPLLLHAVLKRNWCIYTTY